MALRPIKTSCTGTHARSPSQPNPFHIGARQSSSISELDQKLRIGQTKEDESTVQNLIKAASDVTAALFALKLIKESDTSRAELVLKVSKLLTEASEELKKALHSQQP